MHAAGQHCVTEMGETEKENGSGINMRYDC